MSDGSKLIYQCSKTKAGKALLSFIDDECNRRFKGSAEEIQQQSGKFNLYLDILDEIEDGKSESN